MAETWSCLRGLLDNGASLKGALGLELSSRDAASSLSAGLEGSMSVGVASVDEVFSIKLPTVNDVQLLGLSDIHESLSVLPPFLDLSLLLEPMYIPEPFSDEPKPQDATKEEPVQQNTTHELHKRYRQESISPSGEPSIKRLRTEQDSPELIESSDEDSFMFIDLTQ